MSIHNIIINLIAEPIFPYLEAGPWKFGPFFIQMFGLMVGIGIIAGVYTIQLRGFKKNLDTDHVSNMTTIGLFGLFFGAHLYSVLFYFPEKILKDPLVIFKIWEGIASFGGLIGMLLTIYIYTKVKKLDFFTFVDVFMWGSVHAWIFGRIGCSFAHDHPGNFTDSWFSVKWPANHLHQIYNVNAYPGRHDLGLYELLFTIILLGILYLTNRKGDKFPGFTFSIIFILYAPVRFFMDFLRTQDAKYFSLTPAQYSSILMFIIGVVLFKYLYDRNKKLEGKNV
jgi:phosphatidylglycerol---prolipoprotein diacylglyceryl transferase